MRRLPRPRLGTSPSRAARSQPSPSGARAAARGRRRRSRPARGASEGDRRPERARRPRSRRGRPAPARRVRHGLDCRRDRATARAEPPPGAARAGDALPGRPVAGVARASELVHVRYPVDDVEAAIAFCTGHLGSSCCRTPMPDGGRPGAGGWSRTTSSAPTSRPRSSACAARAWPPARAALPPGGPPSVSYLPERRSARCGSRAARCVCRAKARAPATRERD